MSTPQDDSQASDWKILEAARIYRLAYAKWRKLDRLKEPTLAQVEQRLDAQSALATAERAALAAMRRDK